MLLEEEKIEVRGFKLRHSVLDNEGRKGHECNVENRMKTGPESNFEKKRKDKKRKVRASRHLKSKMKRKNDFELDGLRLKRRLPMSSAMR